MSRSTNTITRRNGRHASASTRRRRRTVTIPAADFPSWRRGIIRSGGAVILSAPVVGGYVVTYVIGHGR